MQEFYVSIDIEADGPIPGPHSMLSLGAWALTQNGGVAEKFEVNLDLLEGAVGDPDTMAWWATQPREIWEACRSNPQPPAVAMGQFVEWVGELANRLGAAPICVAYPASFDFMFVHWYITKLGLKNPFGFSCIDMRSYAMGRLGRSFEDSKKKAFPPHWLRDLPPHNHVASADALEQGTLFLNMLNDRGVA